jgi:dipeptide/tripeptide permease
MKHTALVLFLVLSFAAKGQQMGIMAVPDDTLATRMNIAGEHMRKAAFDRNTSLWWALFGGAFTALAMDRSQKAYQPNLAFGIGAVTCVGFFSFQLAGAVQDRKAARALHVQ